MWQKASLQATQKLLHMTAFGKMYWRSLYTIMTHQNDCTTAIIATILMTMNVDNIIDIHIQSVIPIETFIAAIIIIVAIHQLIWSPFDDQRLNGLVEAQIARHGLIVILLRVEETEKSKFNKF